MLHNKIIQHMRHAPMGLFLRQRDREKVHFILAPPMGVAMLEPLSQGQLLLGAERALSLLLESRQQEMPFSYRLEKSEVEAYRPLTRLVDLFLAMSESDWEALRLKLATHSEVRSEFVAQAHSRGGQVTAKLTLAVAFRLEKFLPA